MSHALFNVGDCIFDVVAVEQIVGQSLEDIAILFCVSRH